MSEGFAEEKPKKVLRFLNDYRKKLSLLKIKSFYDQTDVIDRTIETVKKNLVEGGVLVMVILLLASLFSWYYIFLKYFALRRATALANEFEKQFWSGADLNDLHQRAMNSRTEVAATDGLTIST